MSGKAGLAGRSVVITVGPTREYLDPVRYLTNASSGRMGRALALACRARGARVVAVCGPIELTMPSGVKVVPVVSAGQMYRRTLALARGADLVIGAAAVGDYRFAGVSRGKLKKTRAPLTLTLLPNPDILAELGRRRFRAGRRAPLLAGFALETGRWLDNARAKLREKRLDLIVANRSASLEGDRTRIAVLCADGERRVFPPTSKRQAAEAILGFIERRLARTEAHAAS